MRNTVASYIDIIHPEKKSTIFYLDNSEKFISVAWGQYYQYLHKIIDSINQSFNGNQLTFGVYHDKQILWDLANYAIKIQGSCLIGLNHLDNPHQTSKIIELANIDVVVCSSKQLDQLSRIWSGNFLVLDLDDNLSVDIKVKQSIIKMQHPEFSEKIATSGTTGNPKLYFFTEQQLIESMQAISDFFEFELSSIKRSFSWMPLANPFQRMLNLVALLKDKDIYYIDDPRQPLKFCKQAKVEFFVSIPRLYEKIEFEVNKRLRQIPVIGHLFNYVLEKCSKRQLTFLDKASILYSHLLLRKIVLSFFSPDLKYLLSGSARLPTNVEIFFENIKLPVFQSYGMSECLLPISMSNSKNRKLGSAGKMMLLNRLQVVDKELQVASPFMNYPFLDEFPGQFYHSGDFCEIDEEGFIFVKGRKSDFFKTTTGRRISPYKIEDCLKALDGINFACVYGEGFKYPIAILDVNDNFINRYIDESELKSIIIDKCSNLNDYEIPKVILVVKNRFSPDSGELTPNVKLKRQNIAKIYNNEVMDLINANQGHELIVRLLG